MLLDSVIVIDRLNHVPAALAFFGGHVDLAVSAVTVAEVLAGVEEDGHAAVSAFLGTFAFLGVDSAVAEHAGRLRRTESWKLPDPYQTACMGSQPRSRSRPPPLLRGHWANAKRGLQPTRFELGAARVAASGPCRTSQHESARYPYWRVGTVIWRPRAKLMDADVAVGRIS